MYTCDWCPQIRDFRKGIINQSTGNIYSFLKQNGYEYIVLDYNLFNTYGENTTQEFVNSLMSTKSYNVVHQADGMIIAQVI